ncbi:vacuolar protein sorting-associated protein 13 [Mycena amicta]|nr:vacuolar protein sorting-associated protein 13 [Mycena amicta]
MWWLDPGKEVLHVVFNKILAPYVENLDMNQVNYGIGQGKLTLRNLRLKKGALDKFRLPVDVQEGYLGKFTLSLHWMNLGNQPVEIMVEDVYLLVVPSPQSTTDAQEEENRAQATKMERLENAELLHMRGQAESTEDTPQSQGLIQSLMAKVINNLQITVKNIHIRYEDKFSVPKHPFAAGITLAGFTAVSVDGKWQPSFIESTAGAIHKLANLQSLAVYFDTDSPSLAGLPPAEAIKKFSALVSTSSEDKNHQFILTPVSGEGRVTMNHKFDKTTPQFDVQLLFQEIGVSLDDKQYRDIIALVDMYHVYMRQHQYRKFFPGDTEFTQNPARARLLYAGTAILEGVRERRRKWTWAYFAERRDDRNKYVDLFQQKSLNALAAADVKVFEALEKKLSVGAPGYGVPPPRQTRTIRLSAGPMTEEQRKQLYDVLDYDEKAAVAEALSAPRDSLKARIAAKLNKGSLALKTLPRGGPAKEIISIVFDIFQANVIQRPDNLEASVSLGGFGVFDGTTTSTLYPQIVQVKDMAWNESLRRTPSSLSSFEHNPLDERADNGLTVRMRHMTIIYHKGYVEAIYKFFAPASQLESVEALLSAASETLEGLRKETRAGLEYALQTHKTIDIQMDLKAPVIIIPEDITTHQCKHLIIDAGHIAIESNLADKQAIRAIHLKRNKQYSEEDFKQLENLCYDRFDFRLDSAQFVLGNDLQSCQEALTSDAKDTLHLLERINIDLEIQNSIVPTAFNLARFKVAGHLPTLQVNLSDTKYKALMRLIDVCIPKFGNEPSANTPPPLTKNMSSTFQLPSVFTQTSTEYHVEEDDQPEESKEDEGEDTFFEATDGSPRRPEIHQHIFEVNFRVDNLRASLSKSGNDGVEKPLGDVELKRFALMFALAKFDMKVDVNLQALAMNVVQPGAEPIKFVSSPESDLLEDKDLLSLTYRRVQKESPEFLTVYEGIDQSVDIQLSTFVFRAAPEPVVALYDFIMTTFVPQSGPAAEVSPVTPENEVAVQASAGKIRVLVKLASVQVTLIHGTTSLATLSLSTADVAVLVLPKTLQVTGRLGSLALSNESSAHPVREEFSQIVSIEGQNFGNFRYQTLDPDEEGYTGIKSSVYLAAASVKFHYLEDPLHEIFLFLQKLAKLKGLYDAATQVAVQRASEIERMQFDVSIKSPIVVFPSNPASSRDALVLRLGEITAKNTYEGVVNNIAASLTGIQLVSNLHVQNEFTTLKIVDDIDVSAAVVQTGGIDRQNSSDYPDTQVSVKISDVRLHLTQVQYVLLIGLSQSIPRLFATGPDAPPSVQPPPSMKPTPPSVQSLVDLQPELKTVDPSNGPRPWTSLDLVVVVDAIKLHLYDGFASRAADLKEHGIARFALNNNTLRLKLLSDGSGEAQVVLKSFTVGNTRPGSSRFREIIPAAQHDRNQFMVLYTMSGGTNSTALAVLTVDSPQVIFAVDPLIALMRFFTSAFTTGPSLEEVDPASTSHVQPVEETAPPQSTLDFRVDLHDVSVSILENDSDAESPAMKLTINQVLLSQQGILALTIGRLGMSLVRMGKPAESVRFLDDFDLTFSLDGRSASDQQMTSIEISAKPIVFRASYRDINMIMTIVNKAIELSSDSQEAKPPARVSAQSVRPSQTRITKGPGSQRPVGKARVLMSKEMLKGSFDGFRLVLIGDMHEQPMLHLKVKPFIIGAKDWSGELQATTTMATQISYWNLTNSHWEPLIDPWTFTTSISKNSSNAMSLTLSSRERLDLNLTTTFAELAVTTFNMWAKQGEFVLQKARGSYAPYRISNRTGSPVFVWADVDGNASAKDVPAVKIPHDETVDWRFDDWKTMREHVSSSQHNVGIQIDGKPWDQLRSIPVDREGEYIFTLRSRTEKHSHRLLVEVKVLDTVKVVTLRSTYKVENLTLYPIELTLVDDSGHPVQSLEKIAPGEHYSLPIEAVTLNKIRIQPDQGFGYKWCPAIHWEDLMARRNLTIKCAHTDAREAAFRFQAWVQTDSDASRKYPKITLKLRAPIELENLLPYNLEYRIYDKDTDQNWTSYLRQGGVMPVHSVELTHLVLLNVEIQDTIFKPSDFAIINTNQHSDFDIEKRLSLRDANDRKLDLRLNYLRYPESGGAFKVQIYSPYIIINKMGLPYAVRSRSGRTGSPQDVAGETRPDVLVTSVPFMLSHPNDKGNEYIFRVGDSAWSRVFSFEAPSAETHMVAVSQKQKTDEVHIGISWSEGLGKYKLSKVITLAPRFVIKNNLAEAISFREHGVAPRDRSIVKAGERCPLHLLRAEQDHLLTIAFPGLNAQWSPPIRIEDIGTVHLRLRSPTREHNPDLIRADIRIDGSTIFVIFSSAADAWPFMIENESDYVAIQTLVKRRLLECNRQTVLAQLLSCTQWIPDQVFRMHGTFPAATDKKIQLSINGFRRTVDVMEIGDLVPFKFNDGQRNRVVSLDVRADGQKQVLRITNYNAELSLYKPKRSNTLTLSRQDTMSSEAFDAITEESLPTLAFAVDFAGIGISLVNKRIEVIYVSMNALKFEYTSSAVAHAVTLSCGTVQIDNQLHDALYPVILQPTPIPKRSNGNTAALPTVQASVIWLKDQAHGVLFIKYCSILLQALTIEADEDLLFSIYDLTQIKGASWDEGVPDVLIQADGDIQEPSETPIGEDLYFEVLELQPIKLSLSFMRTERVSAEEKLSIRNPLAVVINAITMAVGNINDAPLEMNALAIKDLRLTMPELQTRITMHYRQDLIRQLYRILGSADFIGNPVGLFTNVSSGVLDVFYEPFNAVVHGNNKELGIGIAKGAGSFVKKTVFGLSDSMTKFTSSVGKGLSAATFDSEYQTRRRLTQRRNKPRHAIYGVTAGGEALASSVASAMEGVLMKPIEGAESEGAFGFFKGVGKGLVGAVTKPVVGVFDLASNVSEGIRNTTTVFDGPARDRVRLPRHVSADGVLRPYDARAATGQYWLRDLDNGTYRQEVYVAHINTPGGDNVVLLTTTRVLSFWSKKLRLDWELPFSQVQGVSVEDTGIRFAHKSGRENDKFVFIQDKTSASWFFAQVASVVKAYNSRRRQDV